MPSLTLLWGKSYYIVKSMLLVSDVGLNTNFKQLRFPSHLVFHIYEVELLWMKYCYMSRVKHGALPMVSTQQIVFVTILHIGEIFFPFLLEHFFHFVYLEKYFYDKGHFLFHLCHLCHLQLLVQWLYLVHAI